MTCVRLGDSHAPEPMRTQLLQLAAAVFLAFPALAGSGWKLAGPYGGSATSISIDRNNPDHMLAGARSALVFRSLDGGRRWTMLPLPYSPDGSVRFVWIDPRDSRRYLVGLLSNGVTGSGLWESRDRGETWSPHPQLASHSLEALAVYPKQMDTMALAARDGVWLSTDNAKTWRRITPEDNPELLAITAVAFDPQDAAKLYAGTPHLPWKTSDGGRKWVSIAQGMIDDSDVFSIFIQPEKPDNVFASACSGIYRSASGGKQWAKFTGIPGESRRTHVIRQEPGNPNVLYAGTTLGLWKSTDGGESWKRLNHHHVNSLDFHPRDPKILYLATEFAGIWRSSDGGNTIYALNEGFANRKVSSLSSSGQILLAATFQEGAAGGVFTSQDGERWSLRAGGDVLNENHLRYVSAAGADTRKMFAASESRILRSTTGGMTWEETPSLPGRAPRQKQSLRPVRIHALRLLPGDAQAVLAGTEDGLFISRDAGDTWKEIRITGRLSMPTRAIYTDPGGKRFIVRTAHELFLSENSGANWRAVGIPLDSSKIFDIAISSDQRQPILMATAEGLYQTLNFGQNWYLRGSGLPVSTVHAVQYHPARTMEAFAVQHGDLYKSSDGGSSWQRVVEASLPAGSVRSLWFSPRMPQHLFAVSPNVGLYLLNLESLN